MASKPRAHKQNLGPVRYGSMEFNQEEELDRHQAVIIPRVPFFESIAAELLGMFGYDLDEVSFVSLQ